MLASNRLKHLPAVLLATGALSLTSSFAHAEDGALYIRALGNIGLLADSSLNSGPENGSLGNGDAEFDAGFGAGAAVGYDFGNWRLEGEVLYRTNTLDSLEGTVYNGADDGDFSSVGVGLNVMYEFNVFSNPHITSYAGAGLVWFQEIDIDVETSAGEFSYSGDDTAWQLMVGARYDLQNQFALYAELRQLFASNLDLDGEGAAVGTFEADYDRTELVFGVSYRF